MPRDTFSISIDKAFDVWSVQDLSDDYPTKVTLSVNPPFDFRSQVTI